MLNHHIEPRGAAGATSQNEPSASAAVIEVAVIGGALVFLGVRKSASLFFTGVAGLMAVWLIGGAIQGKS